MKGRALESLVGGMLPFRPFGQQPKRFRRVGVLHFSEHDPESDVNIPAFLMQLEKLGWTTGKNLQIDYRWTGIVESRIHQYAAELVALAPDVILAVGNKHVAALQQITHAIPIVFVQVVDALGSGLVKSRASSRSPATGFTNCSESDFSVKRLELLKQIAPRTARTAILRDPSISYVSNWPVPPVLARSFGLVAAPLYLGFDLGSGYASQIEDSIAEFAEKPDGSLIVLSSPFTISHRELIISLACRYRLPAIYGSRSFITAGGLISYGTDPVDQYRRAAGYVDHILKGKKIARLPIQQLTKVALRINLNTAKALNLEVPPTLRTGAEEVIE
jgi:putative tryptophan/tyrosine transport system substrate-binding protein